MPTAQEIQDDNKFVESQGYSLALLDRPAARGTWYRPDGKPIPNQPVDGYARSRNRRKGWTLRPPEKPAAGITLDLPLFPDSFVREQLEAVKTMEPPPKHIHVMQEAIGSPCLVRGCTNIRQNPKGKFVVSAKRPKSRRVKETATAS